MWHYARILCDLIQRFVPDGKGVEIGIKRGYASKIILEHTSTQHLYMIDPWMWDFGKQNLYSDKEPDPRKKKNKSPDKNRDLDNPDKDYEYVVSLFSKKFPQKHTIIRKKSENAADEVPDDSDFVFIDGDHSYEYVTKDLVHWVPKIRPGGLIVGHDWWVKFPDVEKAVVDFCATNDVFLPPEYELEEHIPAPSRSPVIMKSWPKGRLWWAIKKLL